MSDILSYFTPKSKKKAPEEQVPCHHVYRDDLNKKKPKTGKRVQFESTPKLIERGGDVRSHDDIKFSSRISTAGTRTKVQILMTKQEAARLLSKCKHGGVLEFKDVARELQQIPPHRVNVVDLS